MQSRIGFIGLGIIGLPMAERLTDERLPLAVWNRSPEKARQLAAKGVAIASSPRELAAGCDIVITMVSDGPALRDVTERPDGVAAGFDAGKIHLDMSTIDVDTSSHVAAFHAARGAHFVHAPVLGNKRHAAAGELLIFTGGPAGAIEKCRPVFAALGKKTWTWDQPGQATCIKLACNLLLGGMIELLSESLALAAKAGADPRTLIEILGMSALGAPMFQAKGSLMAERNFAISFYLRHMLKDLRLAADAGAQLGQDLPATRAIRDVYGAAADAGYADRDYSSVMEWLETADKRP